MTWKLACMLRTYIKYESKDQLVIYTRFAWKLACMLGTCGKCDPTDGFSKYELNNKLLVGVTFLKLYHV